MALKRKKQYDAQIDKLGAARMNIESIIFAVESATTNFAALNAVRTGAQTLQQISRHMYALILASGHYGAILTILQTSFIKGY